MTGERYGIVQAKCQMMIYLSLVRRPTTSRTIDPLILSTCSMVSRSLTVHSRVILLKLSPNNHEDGEGRMPGDQVMCRPGNKQATCDMSWVLLALFNLYKHKHVQ